MPPAAATSPSLRTSSWYSRSSRTDRTDTMLYFVPWTTSKTKRLSPARVGGRSWSHSACRHPGSGTDALFCSPLGGEQCCLLLLLAAACCCLLPPPFRGRKEGGEKLQDCSAARSAAAAPRLPAVVCRGAPTKQVFRPCRQGRQPPGSCLVLAGAVFLGGGHPRVELRLDGSRRGSRSRYNGRRGTVSGYCLRRKRRQGASWGLLALAAGRGSWVARPRRFGPAAPQGPLPRASPGTWCGA